MGKGKLTDVPLFIYKYKMYKYKTSFEEVWGANSNKNNIKYVKCTISLTQQNSYSINHLGTVTTRLLDSDTEVTVDNCPQHADYTVDEVCSHCATGS